MQTQLEAEKQVNYTTQKNESFSDKKLPTKNIYYSESEKRIKAAIDLL